MTCFYTKWALEMERAACALEEQGLPAAVVRGNRNVAMLLRRAAKTEAALEKLREMAGNSPRDYEFASEEKLRALGLWREPKA